MPSSENFALGGFTFDVDESQRFTPWTPVVHRQIEFGKSPKDMENADRNAPSGVEDITFMYGGWTNHPNAVKAATWDEANKTWGFNDNGTKNTKYTINDNEKTDKWEDVKAESATTEQLFTLDGYAKFTAGCGQVPTDQYGNIYTPTTSAVPSVANIPCRGTYYKFEPAKDGTLNVYVRQAANSPLFLVDETGKPQKSIDYKAGNDATFTEGTDASYIINKLAACRYGLMYRLARHTFYSRIMRCSDSTDSHSVLQAQQKPKSASHRLTAIPMRQKQCRGNPYQTTPGKCMECHLSAI